MINREWDQQIKEWIDAHRQELLEQWMELIRVPSVRGEAAPGAPYGVESARAMRLAGSYFEKAGFRVREGEGNHYALAEWGTHAKTIGTSAHCDVVPVGDGWIYTDPFEPIVKDGYLIGRGSRDNKNGAMAALAAMRILKELKIPFRSNICTYLGAAEESRMPDIQEFIKQEKMPDLSLVPDSSFPCCVGEKTIYRFMAECGEPLQDILEFNGGDAMNVVLDRVSVTLKKSEALAEELKALTAGKKEFDLSGGEETLCLKAYGAPKHAAHPEGSVNAAVLAAELLKDCQSLAASDRACLAQLAQWIGSCHGEGLGIAFEDPDFGKLTSANGVVRTENGRLSFGMDIRFGTDLDHLETEAAVTALLEKAGWKVTYVLNRKGYKTEKSSPIPGALTEIYNEITGLETKPYYMAGGTYSRTLKNAFTIGAGAFDPESKAVCPELPAGHGGAHQRDEVASVDGYFQAVRILVHDLLACDRFLNE